MWRKLKINLNLTRIMGTLCGDQYTFIAISRSVLLRMRNVSGKNIEKIKTQVYVQ
jgi:hypothetical protein